MQPQLLKWVARDKVNVRISEESHAVEVRTFPDDQDPRFETYQIAEDVIEAWSKAEPPMCNGQKPEDSTKISMCTTSH